MSIHSSFSISSDANLPSKFENPFRPDRNQVCNQLISVVPTPLELISKKNCTKNQRYENDECIILYQMKRKSAFCILRIYQHFTNAIYDMSYYCLYRSKGCKMDNTHYFVVVFFRLTCIVIHLNERKIVIFAFFLPFDRF